MAVFKNFSKKSRHIKDGDYDNLDSSFSHDPIVGEGNSLSDEEWIKFIAYYRVHIDKFATDVLKLKLHIFQCLLLRAMARYQYVMLICCRGLGKFGFRLYFLFVPPYSIKG